MTSSKANADLVGLDWSEALKMSGVVDKVDASDIPNTNTWTWAEPDEQVFVTGKVCIHGGRVGECNKADEGYK